MIKKKYQNNSPTDPLENSKHLEIIVMISSSLEVYVASIRHLLLLEFHITVTFTEVFVVFPSYSPWDVNVPRQHSGQEPSV